MSKTSHSVLRATVLAALAIWLIGPAAGQRPASSPAASGVTPEQEKERDLRGPSIDETYLSSLTPQAREAAGFVDIREGELNPFGMVSAALSQLVGPARPPTEEEKIRRVLRNLRVGGLSGQPGAYRVLLGPLSLGVGDEVPRLFVNQAEELRVQEISPREVVLQFVEKDGGAEPRTIALPFDLSPAVDPLLVGEMFLKLVPFDNEGNAVLPPRLPLPVDEVLQGIRGQDMQSLVDRSTELMDAPAVLDSNEKPTR
jgi:hypothetical protein